MDLRYSDILSRTGEIYQRFGIRSVSMDDLSRRLGISKKTLYTYVSNKGELVEQVMLNRHQQDKIKVEHLSLEEQNAIDFLLNMSKMVCLRLININPSMIFDLQKYYPETMDKLYHLHREYYAELFLKNLNKGIEEGLYRQEIDKELTIRSYLHSMEKFFGEELPKTKQTDPTQMFRTLFGNHIRAIASSHGLAYFEQKEHEMNYNIEQ